MNVGMLPRRSNNVCSLTADLVERNSRPWKHRQAQVDGGRVQRVDGVVELQPQVLVAIQGASDANHGLRERGVDAPVPAPIGVGERVARHPTTDTHVIELVLMSAQTRFDIAQALAEGELRECHA